VVLISGAGSNLASLLENLPATQIPADVVAVGSDTNAPGPSREEWGVALGDALASHEPDLIILSGFMKLLPPGLVSRFSPRILNTHPAYLPEFPGAHAVRDALASGATETGASVIVVDEGVDTGQILAQRRIPVEPGDDEATLHARIKVLERELLLHVLENITTAIGK